MFFMGLLGVLVGFAASRFVDHRLERRVTDPAFLKVELAASMQASRELAENLARQPVSTAERATQLLDLVRAQRDGLRTEDAKALLTMDVLDLTLMVDALTQAERSERTVRAQVAGMGGPAPAANDPGPPATPHRQAWIIERNAELERRRAAYAIHRIRSRSNPGVTMLPVLAASAPRAAPASSGQASTASAATAARAASLAKR
jgi:hypothetical protein